jgi:hypothetical protein
MTCPLKWQQACRNLDIACHKCRAEIGEGELAYLPLAGSPSIKSHPAYEKPPPPPRKQSNTASQQSNTASQQTNTASKIGRATERRVLRNLGARTTVASGAIFGDGDGSIVIDGETWRIEHKTRVARRNTLGPTEDEWATAQAQGCRLFITTHNNRSVVTMDITDLKSLVVLPPEFTEGVNEEVGGPAHSSDAEVAGQLE